MRPPAGIGARIAFVIACAVLPALVAWLLGQALCTPSEAAAPIDAADVSGARGCWEPVAAAMLFGGLGWLAGWITVLRPASRARPPQ